MPRVLHLEEGNLYLAAGGRRGDAASRSNGDFHLMNRGEGGGSSHGEPSA